MKIFRKLFSKTPPTEFSENGLQVNLNSLPATREENGEVVEGYVFDTVVFEETDYVYTEQGRKDAAIVFEAQDLLDSTQYKFGDDYDQKDTPEYAELTEQRRLARLRIRAIKGN